MPLLNLLIASFVLQILGLFKIFKIMKEIDKIEFKKGLRVAFLALILGLVLQLFIVIILSISYRLFS
jgi:hypothetical protein